METLRLWLLGSSLVFPLWLSAYIMGLVSFRGQDVQQDPKPYCAYSIDPIRANIGLEHRPSVDITEIDDPGSAPLTRRSRVKEVFLSIDQATSRLVISNAAFIWQISSGSWSAIPSSTSGVSDEEWSSHAAVAIRHHQVEAEQACVALRDYQRQLNQERDAIEKDAIRARRVQEKGEKDEDLTAQERGNKNSLRQLRRLPDQLSGPFNQLERGIDRFVHEIEQLGRVLGALLYLIESRQDIDMRGIRLDLGMSETQVPTVSLPGSEELETATRAWLVFRLLCACAGSVGTPAHLFSDLRYVSSISCAFGPTCGYPVIS